MLFEQNRNRGANADIAGFAEFGHRRYENAHHTVFSELDSVNLNALMRKSASSAT